MGSRNICDKHDVDGVNPSCVDCPLCDALRQVEELKLKVSELQVKLDEVTLASQASTTTTKGK